MQGEGLTSEKLTKEGVISEDDIFRDRTVDPQNFIVSGRRTSDDNR